MSSPSVRDKSFEQPSSGRSYDPHMPYAGGFCFLGAMALSMGMGVSLGEADSGSLNWGSAGACFLYAGGALMVIGLLHFYCAHRARPRAQIKEPVTKHSTQRSRPFEITT